MKTTILTFYILIIALTSCETTQNNGFTPTLPPITQTGENTFGCYVDGKLLVPRDGTGYYGGSEKGMKFIGISNNAYNEIKVRDFKSGNGGLFILHIENFIEIIEGNFIIDDSNCQQGLNANDNINITCRWWNNNTQEYNWYCSIENGGTLKITKYDVANDIYSGVFSCTAQNRDNPNDIIEITEGRFDINGYTLSNTNFP